MATAETQILLDLEESAIVVPDPDLVKAYLQRAPDLAALVPAVCAAIRREFGDDAELALELYIDPEIADRYLTLYLRQDAYTADTVARIDRACAPFEEELTRASGQLLVTTDLRLPRRGHGV